WSIRSGGKPVRELVRQPGGTLAWVRDAAGIGHTIFESFEAAPGGEQRRAYHLDHLGSTRAVTGAGGDLVASFAYFPFGAYAATCAGGGCSGGPTTRLRFTGQERDDNEDGEADDLDYMLARYYAPGAGRFTSVDPESGNAMMPQSWN